MTDRLERQLREIPELYALLSALGTAARHASGESGRGTPGPRLPVDADTERRS